jgi:hypothetical protein
LTFHKVTGNRQKQIHLIGQTLPLHVVSENLEKDPFNGQNAVEISEFTVRALVHIFAVIKAVNSGVLKFGSRIEIGSLKFCVGLNFHLSTSLWRTDML